MSLLSAQAQYYKTKGKFILNPKGEPVQLKGINLGNWLVPEGYMFHFKDVSSPRKIEEMVNELVGPEKAKEFWTAFLDKYISREDIHFIKQTGFNSLRLPFNYKLFTDEPYLGGRNRGFELFDKVIDWCKKEQIGIVLDMHCAPGGQTGDNIDDSYGFPYLFESEAMMRQTIDIWKKIASRYSKETVIIGYDLLNEPIAHYFDSARFNPRLEPLYKRLVEGIREVDKNHIIFLGGAQWNTNFKIFGLPFDNNLVYTFHKYWTEPTKVVVQEYIDYGERYNVPLWLGESGENTDDWINSFRTMLDSNQVGWCFWPYKKLDSPRCVIQIPKFDSFQKIIDYSKSPRHNFEDIRKVLAKTDNPLQSLNDFIEQCAFKNCKPNAGYIKALGMKME